MQRILKVSKKSANRRRSVPARALHFIKPQPSISLEAAGESEPAYTA
jgi:hypothetical protein